MLRRRTFLRLAGLGAASAISRSAVAQSYPSRPVRLVVPFSAGGTTDLIARLMGQWLSDRLGQPVVIENRPGGGTNIAVQAVANAAPDGNTLLFTVTTNVINPSLYRSLPFDFARDITPVSGLAELPLVMSVRRAGKDDPGIRRPRQSQSRQGQRCLVRRAHHQSSVDRIAQIVDRHRRRSRAIPRRRGDDVRSHSRSDPGGRRRAAELAAACP